MIPCTLIKKSNQTLLGGPKRQGRNPVKIEGIQQITHFSMNFFLSLYHSHWSFIKEKYGYLKFKRKQ